VGFLPREKKQQKNLLGQIAAEPRTLIFYESPHRLLATLETLKEHLGDRPCCVARELTKLYEEYRRGTLSQVMEHFRKGPVKGELTVMVAGHREEEKKDSPTWETIESYIQELLEQGLSTGEAAKEAGRRFGLSKREIYNRLVRTKE